MKSMMEMKWLALPVLLALGLTACSKPTEEAIVGKWRTLPPAPNTAAPGASASSRGGITFEFKHDGALITQGDLKPLGEPPGLKAAAPKGTDKPVNHRYSSLDEQTLRVKLGKGSPFPGRGIDLQVSISGNKMVLTEIKPSGIDWGGERGVIKLERVE
jgi:hypothetical protein